MPTSRRRPLSFLLIAMAICMAWYFYLNDNGIGLFVCLLIITHLAVHVMLQSKLLDTLITLFYLLLLLLIPAMMSVQDAKQQMLRGAMIRKVAIAFHQYHNDYHQLPALSIRSKNGLPLLSWRVTLLPFLGYDELYRQFRLDEPWSSDHNIKLLSQAPDCYLPVHHRNLVGHTHLVALTGSGSIYSEPKMTLREASLGDGLGETAMLGESARLIPWTKPDDEDFSPDLVPPSLMAYPESSCACKIVMLDGKVRNLYKSRVNNYAQLRKLITWRGNDPVDPDFLD